MTATVRHLPGIPPHDWTDYTTIEPRPLPHRKHAGRPAPGSTTVAHTEWCIETQLSIAHDTGETDLYEVLAAFNPNLDGKIREHIEDLFSLSAEVADAEESGPRARFHHSIDEYNDALYAFARLLRGEWS